jgi:hypothetical protein
MDELETALRRERWLLGILLFRQRELQLLREAGEARFLEWAQREVDVAHRNVREGQLICAVMDNPEIPDSEVVAEHRNAIFYLQEEINRTCEKADQKV